ncbi:MAG: MBL fold metallo-hydrolase [Planctomycetes bacterium]|nr:MBL fold metallo-hydrolase [Planctomycetota bacterium]
MKQLIGLLLGLSCAASACALTPGPNDVLVRVADVGAGLCCVVQMPGSHYMVYDTGNWKDAGATCLSAVRELVPEEQSIDLMVLSHTDSDHLGAAADILEEYDVDRVLHTGARRYGKTAKTLKRTRAAIRAAVAEDDTEELNLRRTGDISGTRFQFGPATVTLVCGFGKLPQDWDLTSDAERNNAPSIVVRLQYKGRSVLFCGDAVGRHSGTEDDDALIATEAFMVENRDAVSIDSEVLIAPHHGADNGSSNAFIRAVTPEYVVFSAGHEYEHPRRTTAARYLSAGVAKKRLLRTDWGDDEGDVEWGEGRVPGAKDQPGDDDVDILIRSDGSIAVDYRDPQHPAPDP